MAAKPSPLVPGTKPTYLKHLVECNCILPQFRNHNPPVFHRFVVFSVITVNGTIKPSYVECPHCGAIHRVTEVGVSVQLHKESMPTPQVSEIRTGIPPAVAELLDAWKCPIHTWQETRFIYDHELWGTPVILTKEDDGELVVGKYVLILGKDLYKVDSFTQGEDE